MLQEKYRPKTLSDLSRLEVIQILKTRKPNDFPNFIFVGQEGAGKRTALLAFLEHFYGTVEYIPYTMNMDLGTKKLEIPIIESKHSIEINVSGLGYNDKKIIQKLAKDLSETKSIKTIRETTNNLKILIISDGQDLSQGAQMALRRIIEQGANTFRIIILTTSTNKYIEPFNTRFLTLRINAMSDDQLLDLLKHITENEQQTVPIDILNGIVKESLGNGKKAISLLELYIHSEQKEFKLPWEQTLNEISEKIRNNPTVKEIVGIRDMLYKMLEKNIPGTEILSTLLTNLLHKESDIKKAKELIDAAALYATRICSGNKDLFHLEAFIAKSMSIYVL